MHNRTDPAWVEKCVDVSLQKAGLDYIDLYLIHDPNGGPDVRAAMWEGCCRVKDSGKVRSIGVRCAKLVQLHGSLVLIAFFAALQQLWRQAPREPPCPQAQIRPRRQSDCA